MKVLIRPCELKGSVTPPPSKSMAHRLMIAAGLGSGESRVENVAFSKDIEATLRCMEALGCRYERDGSTLTLHGRCAHVPAAEFPHMDCGESGSTLRFLIPIALAMAGGGSFIGHGRLMERPQTPYFDLFDEKGIYHALKDGVLTVRGQLTPGEYRLAGNVSSQFFTGLLYALSLLDGPSTVISTTALESADYIEMTIAAMKAAGVVVEKADGRTFRVTPAPYRPFTAAVEADWSQAGFWYAAAFLDHAVTPTGLKTDSAQGDKVVYQHYWRLARPGDVEIDLSDCPDLLPPLAVMAAVRSGTTSFTGAARLRLKESDRLATVAALLYNLGIKVQERPDGLTVTGGHLTGGTVEGANDHRIVMAAAIAATRASGPVTITDAQAVSKSYPDFFDVFKSLGGDMDVL